VNCVLYATRERLAGPVATEALISREALVNEVRSGVKSAFDGKLDGAILLPEFFEHPKYVDKITAAELIPGSAKKLFLFISVYSFVVICSNNANGINCYDFFNSWCTEDSKVNGDFILYML